MKTVAAPEMKSMPAHAAPRFSTGDPRVGPSRRPSGALALNWAEQDVENRFAIFRGGRYTSPNRVLAFVLALPLAGLVFAALHALVHFVPAAQPYTMAIIRPANTYTVGPAIFLFCFAIVMLGLKGRKLRFQTRALALAVVPQTPDFLLNEATARTVLERVHGLVDHPRHFILLNRIDRALGNLHNIGGMSDVSTLLKSQAENDESHVASSFSLVHMTVWAIPVLGFIGTVQGLSTAIGAFTNTLAATTDLAAIKTNLSGVTSGLATSFETTLVALVAALLVQLYLSFQQNREIEFLDECNDYCHANLIARLRLADRAGAGPAPTPTYHG